MSRESYLLTLDGSRESLAAANMAWNLAQKRDASLVALSVVDDQAIWDLLGAGLPGFIGSGPYIAAYEVIQKALRSVSETLLVSFASRSPNDQIKTECIINEGNLLGQVFERAKEHTLVIMGQRYSHPRMTTPNFHSFIRTSLSKRLAGVCPCPLLIIPSQSRWLKARLIISDQTFSADSLISFLSFADTLEAQQEVFCTGAEDCIDKLKQKVTDIVPHSVSVLCHDTTDGEESFSVAVDVDQSTLLVVSTQTSIEGRSTCSGLEIQEFLSAVPHVAVLVLPPVATREQTPTEAKNLVSTSIASSSPFRERQRG